MTGQVLQFRTRSILSYYKAGRGKSAVSFRSEKREKSIENLLKIKTYSGGVTKCSHKRLNRAIENLILASKWKMQKFKDGKEYPFKLSFATLTIYNFGNRVYARDGHKKCLEKLLRWLRDVKGMNLYVWKAELQMKRNDCKQLHYHLTMDAYIDCDELQKKWNQLQREAGYLDTFFAKFGHWDAPSTQIKSVQHVKNLSAYIKKSINKESNRREYRDLRNKYLINAEMLKEVQNVDDIEGKIWDCSLNLKSAFYEIQDYPDIQRNIAQGIASGEIKETKKEHCIIYQLVTNREASSFLPYLDRQFFNAHIESIRNYERKVPQTKNRENIVLEKKVLPDIQSKIDFKRTLSVFNDI